MNVLRRSDIQPGQKVAIVGTGFMGALLTALTVQAGVQVIANTRRPFALELARHYGDEHGSEMDDHWKVPDAVKKLTDGMGCDRVIEADGAQWPLNLAGENTRERGKLIIAGYHQNGSPRVNLQLWNWRASMLSTPMDRMPASIRGIQDAVDAVASGAINPAPLYTHTFSFDQISEAFLLCSATQINS